MRADTLRIVLIGALIAGLIWGGAKLVSTVRGIRNNNPGNIKLDASTTWAGQVPSDAQTDDTFVQFIAPEYGIRAMARILKSYAARGVVTINSIIRTWSQTDQNDYIKFVRTQMGVSENMPLATYQWPALIAAIIQFENGIQPYDSATITRGVSMA